MAANPFDPSDNPFMDPFAPQPQRQPAPSSQVQDTPPAFTGITAGSSRPAVTQHNVLDDFNPFESNRAKPTLTTAWEPAPSPGFTPAVLPTNESSGGGAPPPYSASPAQQISTAELDRRQRELEARAADIARKEEEHRRLESQGLRQGGTDAAHVNNFPPLPNFFPCKPCFSHNIDVDIPVEYRLIVRLGFYLWMAYSLALLINMIAALAYFISNGSAGTVFGFSILYLVIFVPISFICWFRPLYKAFRSDSSFNFFMFFLVFLVQCVVAVLQSLGIDWFATCGWINGLTMMAKNVAVGVIMIIMASLFTAIAVGDIILLLRVHRIYRSSGASFQKARQEFAQGVATNPTVRSTAADFGSAAVRGAVSSDAGPGNRF